MARKFKAHKPEFEHSDFDRLLTEIFPQEIPVKFVSEVKVFYNDGTTKSLQYQELKGIVPKTGVVDANEIAKLWENTKDVEIYINIELLQSIVSLNVKSLLKRF
jgi:hypothetical protein